MGGMKNTAAKVFGPALLALLSVSMAIPACAAYEKCVKPEITAATKLAPADLLKEVSAFLLCGGADLPDLAAPCAVKGLADLAVAIGPGGEEAVNCLVSYLEGNSTDPVLKSRAKAVGAKRGVTEDLFRSHACNGISKKDRGALQVAASPPGPANYDPGLSGRPDVQRWTTMLADGSLNARDFEFLIGAREDLASLTALARALPAGI